MNMQSPAPKPLSHGEFYLLVELYIGEGHAYILGGRIAVRSYGAVSMSSGTFTALLERMHEQGYIDLVSLENTGRPGAPRKRYGISEHGIIRLKEELARLQYIIKTAENVGLFEDELPLNIQRIILDNRLEA